MSNSLEEGKQKIEEPKIRRESKFGSYINGVSAQFYKSRHEISQKETIPAYMSVARQQPFNTDLLKRD